jgi:hypothetical protein
VNVVERRDERIQTGARMYLQRSVQRSGKHPIFDGVFWAAAIVLAVITAFSVVITGIFATDSDSPTIMIVGLSIIFACPVVLLLIIVANLASRACNSRGKSLKSAAMCVTAVIYCVGAPALLFGTWRCVRFLLPAPAYQEGIVAMPYALPTL